MQIDESDEQFEKTPHSIRESLPSGSNLTSERPQQSLKVESQSVSTDDGITIDESDEQPQNAQRSITETLQFDSNVT
jgi:hypothetical protein